MSQFCKHAFVCTYGPYCWFDGDTEAILKRLKQRVGAAGLKDEIRINRSGCLNQCGHGPVMVVYPDGTWYSHVALQDVDEIFAEHLRNGRPVERLLFKAPSGNNKQTGHYPDSVHNVKQLEKELDQRRETARQEIRTATVNPQPFDADSA